MSDVMFFYDWETKPSDYCIVEYKPRGLNYIDVIPTIERIEPGRSSLQISQHEIATIGNVYPQDIVSVRLYKNRKLFKTMHNKGFVK